MRRSLWVCTMIIVVSCAVFLAACGTAPSDEEVIRAVGQSDFFTGGYGHKLTDPVVVVERGKRNKDGTWPVKVRMKFTFEKSKGKKGMETVPMESSPVFKLRQAKDASGKAEWKAELGH